ncbi:hypothetical protein [Actinoplanes sp. NPDC051859]|uniref:hypothetical protein n=1 Tax=Actinoplanes sp. NPDC051859 TaxID=3363909 RepID=UPI00379077AA
MTAPGAGRPAAAEPGRSALDDARCCVAAGRPGAATAPGVSALEHLRGAHADHRLTLAAIGRRRLLRLAAREYVHDNPIGVLWFCVGAPRPQRKIVIVLREDDTYAVEVGRVDRVAGTPKWISEAVVGSDQGVHDEQLGETVERLYAQVTG